ncbi:hypothetical protein [uncultured Bacteroides sp.]|uniref:hypothetical protein n=1 Tax=uncultured Bacteroides sp. TaxID=162156 RepID=UPI002AAB9DBC|nr:hypothetical protein [uncultured Bacteroides sp.]
MQIQSTTFKKWIFICYSLLATMSCFAQEYKIWQFPKEKIPAIDGNKDDWQMIPESYAITIEQMKEDEGKYTKPDKSTLNIKVKVGWCAGLNRLYFLYEAYDNYWRFSENSLSTDIFEVVIDGDCSGGPFIDRFYPDKKADVWEKWFNFHGCQAQNYHIFTPAHKEDWCMLWGPQVWLKQKPYADHAYQYSFKEGEAGKLTLEFYITPFDHADASGPEKSTPSILQEGNNVGLCWAVIDYDANPNSKDGFWNLSNEHTMYGNADYLVKMKLMPLEKQK